MISVSCRTLLALSMALCLVSPAASAGTLDQVLKAIQQTVSGTPSLDNLPRLRQSAEAGNAEAQYLLYEAYRGMKRLDAPPWVSNDRLVSRAEAERGLRAAADQGHAKAIPALAVGLLYGGGMRQDPRAALGWLDRIEPDGNGDAAAELAYLKALALTRAADISEQERLRAIDLADQAIAGGRPIAIGAKAYAVAAKDPVAARKLLEESLDDNPHAASLLARLLLVGAGGPADRARAQDLFETATSGPARAELGRQHLDGGIMPRMPRRAIALMAEYAAVDPETRQQLARLLATYRVKLKNEGDLHFRMLEDADLDLPGAALSVLELHRVHREGFRSEKAWFDLIPRYSASDPEIAVLNVGRLARFAVFSDGRSKTLFEKQIRELIPRLEAQPVPGIFAVHADLLQRGVVFPQDSERAVELLERGAELGDAAAMVALADALESGDGVAKDRKRAIDLFRRAATAGSFEARRKLVRRFRFLSRDNGVAPAEGITNKIAMYGDGMETLGAASMGGFFAGVQMSGLKPAEILAPFYDGFRISPAAAEDDMLVPLIKNTPDWIWKATETVLVHEKYWQGKPAGHMGPEARDAFRRFIADAGPYSYQ